MEFFSQKLWENDIYLLQNTAFSVLATWPQQCKTKKNPTSHLTQNNISLFSPSVQASWVDALVLAGITQLKWLWVAAGDLVKVLIHSLLSLSVSLCLGDSQMQVALNCSSQGKWRQPYAASLSLQHLAWACSQQMVSYLHYSNKCPSKKACHRAEERTMIR